MKYIFMIMGPSGVGKTTLVNELSKKYGYSVVQSYTTRERRTPNETGHTFISEKEFDRLESLVAYTEFAGKRYGVTQDMVDNNDLYVIDPAGVLFFKEHYHGNKKPIVILLEKSDSALAAQMRKRGDSEEAITTRLMHDKIAFFGASSLADYVLSPKSIKAGCDEVHDIICSLEEE